MAAPVPGRGQEPAPWSGADSCRVGRAPSGAATRRPAGYEAARRAKRLQLASQAVRDGAHAGRPGGQLRLAVVVRVRIDVVGIRRPVLVDDVLDAGDVNVVVGQHPLEGLHERMLEPADDAKQRCRRVPGRTEGVVHPARVGRTQLEPLTRIDLDGIQEPAPDELHPRDGGVGRLDVLLQQGHAVHRRLEPGAADVLRQGVGVMEQPNPEALPRTVVLGDERRRQGRRGRDDLLTTDHRHGVGGAYAVGVQGRVLGDLADLELQRPAAVEHPPAVAFEPRQDRGRVLRSEPVVPGMGRSAHPVVEHAVGRPRPEIDDPGVQEPLVKGKPTRVEGRAQRLDPFVVLVKDVDPAHAAACPANPPSPVAALAGADPRTADSRHC